MRPRRPSHGRVKRETACEHFENYAAVTQRGGATNEGHFAVCHPMPWGDHRSTNSGWQGTPYRLPGGVATHAAHMLTNAVATGSQVWDVRPPSGVGFGLGCPVARVNTRVRVQSRDLACTRACARTRAQRWTPMNAAHTEHARVHGSNRGGLSE